MLNLIRFSEKTKSFNRSLLKKFLRKIYSTKKCQTWYGFEKKLNLLTDLCLKSSSEKIHPTKNANLIWFSEKSKPVNGVSRLDRPLDLIEVVSGNQLARHALHACSAMILKSSHCMHAMILISSHAFRPVNSVLRREAPLDFIEVVLGNFYTTEGQWYLRRTLDTNIRVPWNTTRPNSFLRPCHSRVDLLLYESKLTDKWEQYDWIAKKNLDGQRLKICHFKTLDLDVRTRCIFFSIQVRMYVDVNIRPMKIWVGQLAHFNLVYFQFCIFTWN